eukprot:Plantae.Rhodophyta-Hildenbrandia_rubra.ctg11301.p1 GENE.Plantae.Rhodophyta-Hildenbrandia_rubra.ctg11301~~Plantae.Rhodophyta-Hildenbrandia_rubra.ctg11301.p1  ORF type:complete len:782 (+),score=157.62 Plantae.Rhodophyta-Hildenbrandia_rubra.ctg11301:1955-4300(+)
MSSAMPSAMMPTPAKRKPGRPRTYIFDKPDELLTENEQRQKIAVMKRRMRQNRSYQRKKAIRIAAQQAQRANDFQHQHLEAIQNGMVPQAMNPTYGVEGIPTNHAVDIRTFPGNQGMNGMQVGGYHLQKPPLQPQSQPQQEPPQQHQQSSWPQTHMTPFPGVSVPQVSHTHDQSYESLRYVPQQNGSQSSMSASSTAASVGRDVRDFNVPVSGGHGLVMRSDMSPRIKNDVRETSDSMMDKYDENTEIGFGELAPESTFVDGEFAMQEDDIVAETLGAIQTDGISEDVAMMVVDPQPNQASMSGILLPVMTNKFSALDFESQAAVLDLVIFPETFDEKAAMAVTERNGMSHIISQLRAVNFVEMVEPGRFQLHSVAKSFLTTSSAPILQSVLSVAMSPDKASLELRFMKYFTGLLASLEEDENIHVRGSVRAKAIEAFDVERENMRYTQHLSREDSKAALNSFLTAASSVLRFCVPAAERAWYYKDALEIDANSSDAFAIKPELTPPEPVSTFFNEDQLADLGLEPDLELPVDTVCPKMKVKATLQLGLAEAFYDMQQLLRVRDPLNQVHQTLGTTTQLSCIPEIREKTLSLLLCANLAMTEGKVSYAKKSLILALKTLNDGGLAKSTYGVGALLGLIGVYSADEDFNKAKRIADELLGILSSLGFENMPLYADCIGCRAAVLLANEDYAGAEQGFTSSLEIVRDWLEKDWSQVPMQHCLDLDLWLMEGLKRSLMAQGKARQAYDASEKIRLALAKRGIENREGTPLFNWERWWLNARHLY